MGTLVAYWSNMGTTWSIGGYIRPMQGLYKVMGLGVPIRGPSYTPPN